MVKSIIFQFISCNNQINLENKIHIDFIAAAQIFIKEKDETRKAEMMKTFQTEGIPNAIKMFEKLLSANGGKFFVGKEVLCIFISIYSGFLTDKHFQNSFTKECGENM